MLFVEDAAIADLLRAIQAMRFEPCRELMIGQDLTPQAALSLDDIPHPFPFREPIGAPGPMRRGLRGVRRTDREELVGAGPGAVRDFRRERSRSRVFRPVMNCSALRSAASFKASRAMFSRARLTT